MALLRRVLVGSVLLAAYNVYAADYSLDASKMAVGATAGENLIVKEGCVYDPTKTTCPADEKVKWLAAPLTKVGRVEVAGTLEGEFEVVVSGDFDENSNRGIAILTEDGKTLNLAMVKRSFTEFDFFSTGDLGTLKDHPHYHYDHAWIGGYAFNDMKIVVQNGVASAFIGGRKHGQITFDKNTKFQRVQIDGIQSYDRLSEVKVRGLQSASTCSSTSTSTTTSTTTTNGACAANYSSTTGLLAIPCLNVTFSQPFGGVQTLNYSVELQQRSGSLSFDLDANKIKQNN